MLQIFETVFLTIKTGIDCYIIWVVGPDGTLFDIQSILKIIASGIAVLASFGSLMWKLSRRM